MNEVSARSGLGLNDSITMATAHGLSIDQVSDAMMHQYSPQIAADNSSFDFGALPNGSQLYTDRGEMPGQSGGLQVSQLNNKSTTLPSILPAISPNT